jgi:hypothetical protein
VITVSSGFRHGEHFALNSSRIDLICKKHGVKRVRQSKEALELKKQKEQAKIKEYLALTSEVLSRVRNHLSQNNMHLYQRDRIAEESERNVP